MVNRHEKNTIWGICIFSKHFKQIQNDNAPLKLNWNMRISPWKRRLLLETIIVKFHVKLSGCKPWNHKKI